MSGLACVPCTCHCCQTFCVCVCKPSLAVTSAHVSGACLLVVSGGCACGLIGRGYAWLVCRMWEAFQGACPPPSPYLPQPLPRGQNGNDKAIAILSVSPRQQWPRQGYLSPRLMGWCLRERCWMETNMCLFYLSQRGTPKEVTHQLRQLVETTGTSRITLSHFYFEKYPLLINHRKAWVYNFVSCHLRHVSMGNNVDGSGFQLPVRIH